MSIKEQTKQALESFISFLNGTQWQAEYGRYVESMVSRLDTPCVLAVAGEVKAGKSSFINAFLGDDLAMTGVTETTATINYFCYGVPDDPAKPIRCVWVDGRETWESKEFLDSLQGNTEAVLRKATGISRLEFYLNNPKLRNIQLVDTPGTGAHVGEKGDVHENRTREFMQLEMDLRARHDSETRTISDSADAVIYILTGHDANDRNLEYLQKFIGNGSVSAHNAVTVMAKVDMNDDLLSKLDNHIAKTSETINRVLPISVPLLPVSAGIQRCMDRLGESGMQELARKLRSGFESGERLERALAVNERFDAPECRGCSLSEAERRGMHDGVPWRCFVVIARHLYTMDYENAVQSLRRLAGFERVAEELDRHFFQRGTILRCGTVLKECEEILRNIRDEGLYQYRQEVMRNMQKINEFIDFVRCHGEFTENGIGGKLQSFIAEHCEKDRSEEYSEVVRSLAETFQKLLSEYRRVNENVKGLQLLEKHSDMVSQAELEELADLFRGMAASDVNPSMRQLYWRKVTLHARFSERRELADIAIRAYGSMIAGNNN